MTIHPAAVVATLIAISLAALVTRILQGALRRRRGPAQNDLVQWQVIFGIACVVFGGAAWLLLSATGQLPHG